MSLDMDALDEFLDQHEAEPFLIFGFTFIIGISGAGIRGDW